MEYLSQWRFLKSHTMLKYSNDSLDRIAGRIGCSSAQTLGNAFKRHYGYTPASLRQKVARTQLT
jgi:transcriptional regulator GlxA family with amidase domain